MVQAALAGFRRMVAQPKVCEEPVTDGMLKGHGVCAIIVPSLRKHWDCLWCRFILASIIISHSTYFNLDSKLLV